MAKFPMLFDGDSFEYKGRNFRVSFEPDEFMGYPWEDCDGHGPVRISRGTHREGQSDKLPCERPLNVAGRNEYQFYYDWQTACKLAKKDGWNCEPYDAPNRVERAVAANFEFLRAFLSDDWSYVVVTVTEIDENGEETDNTESLGGVESYKDYHVECAYELADELIGTATRREVELNQHMAGL